MPGSGREGPVLFRFCGLVSNRVEKNKLEKITITTKLNQIKPVTHLWSRKNKQQKKNKLVLEKAGQREEGKSQRRDKIKQQQQPPGIVNYPNNEATDARPSTARAGGLRTREEGRRGRGGGGGGWRP